MSRVRPPQALLPSLTALLLLFGSGSAAIAQDSRPTIKFKDKVYLSQHNDKNRYVIEPESSKNWPAMRSGGAGDKVVLEVHGTKEDEGNDIRHGSLVSIMTKVTTHPGYDRFYLSQGGWIYCDTPKELAQADEQWWTIERTAGEGSVRDGDHVRFRNRYWKDQFINIEENGKWLVGSRNGSVFTMDLKVKPAPKLALKNERHVDDFKYVVVPVSNNGSAPLTGSTQTWRVEESQQVQLGEEKSSNWDVGLTVGVEYGGETGIKAKVEATASYGQAMAEQRAALKARNVGTEITLTFDVPPSDTTLHVFKIKMPYVVWDVPATVNNANAESLQLRRLDGQLEIVEHIAIVIPAKADEGFEPIEYAKVDMALNHYAIKNPAGAQNLRAKLPVWQKKGLVTVATGVKSGSPVLIGQPDETRYVTSPESYRNWPAGRHGDRSTALPHVIRTARDGQPLQHGDLVSLETTETTHPGYNRMYLSAGNWIYYDTAKSVTEAPEQWWTIEKEVGGAGLINDGEVVVLRNKKWPDYFLNNRKDGKWLAGGPKVALQLSLAAQPNEDVKTSARPATQPNSEPEPTPNSGPTVTVRPRTGLRPTPIRRTTTDPQPMPEPQAKPQLTLDSLAGRYQRKPLENDWQDITISLVANQVGVYEWKNKADIAWILHAKGTNPVLSTDESNPYFENPEARTVRVESRDGTNEIARIHFNGEVYERVGGNAPRPNPAPTR